MLRLADGQIDQRAIARRLHARTNRRELFEGIGFEFEQSGVHGTKAGCREAAQYNRKD